MPEQYDNLYDCDQRASGMFSEQFKWPLEMENAQYTNAQLLGA